MVDNEIYQAGDFESWFSGKERPKIIRQWADCILNDLGASDWGCFVDETDSGDGNIEQDLKDGGIPLLAARQIVRLIRAEYSRRQSPMAIFWDLSGEGAMPPAGAKVALGQIKQTLAEYGKISYFSAYTRKGQNRLAFYEKKLFQSAGCKIVECSGDGAAAVEKWIMVDAAMVAAETQSSPNRPPATLCFISSDPDLGYLVQRLEQQHPTSQTILVCEPGSSKKMQLVPCNVRLFWKQDGSLDTLEQEEADGASVDQKHQDPELTASCDDTSSLSRVISDTEGLSNSPSAEMEPSATHILSSVDREPLSAEPSNTKGSNKVVDAAVDSSTAHITMGSQSNTEGSKKVAGAEVEPSTAHIIMATPSLSEGSNEVLDAEVEPSTAHIIMDVDLNTGTLHEPRGSGSGESINHLTVEAESATPDKANSVDQGSSCEPFVSANQMDLLDTECLKMVVKDCSETGPATRSDIVDRLQQKFPRRFLDNVIASRCLYQAVNAGLVRESMDGTVTLDIDSSPCSQLPKASEVVGAGHDPSKTPRDYATDATMTAQDDDVNQADSQDKPLSKRDDEAGPKETAARVSDQALDIDGAKLDALLTALQTLCAANGAAPKESIRKHLLSQAESLFPSADAAEEVFAKALKVGIARETIRDGSLFWEVFCDCSPPNKATAEDSAASFKDVVASKKSAKPLRQETDVECLKMVVRECIETSGSAPRKSLVGSHLRTRFPQLFADRSDVKDCLTRAVAKGLLVEEGSGAFKTVTLVDMATKLPPDLTTESRAVAMETIPAPLRKAVKTAPFMAKTKGGRNSEDLQEVLSIQHVKSRAFCKSSSTFYLSFATFEDLKSAFSGLKRSVTFLDCTRHGNKNLVGLEVCCDYCHRVVNLSMLHRCPASSCFCCSQCSCPSVFDEEMRHKAVKRVVNFLTMMADNDDVYVNFHRATHILTGEYGKDRELPFHRWWFVEAVKRRSIVRFRRPEVDADYMCLPRQLTFSQSPFAPWFNTTDQENHVLSLLQANRGCMMRKDILRSLEVNFPNTMKTPFRRSFVFRQGHKKNLFHCATTARGQMIGLTMDMAYKELVRTVGIADQK